MMEWALKYATDGFAVFPVYEPIGLNLCSCGKVGCRGKHPRTPNGVNDATTNAETIRGWWTKWPNASIGMATGAKSSLAVIDLDGPEGIESGRSLSLVSSVIAMTGNGKQLFYADAEGKLRNSVKKLAPGIDTRGAGGYVVVPPSIHPNGKKYCWQSQPLSRNALNSLPALFVDQPTGDGTLITSASPLGNQKPIGWIADALKEMKNGNIDNTLFAVCCRLRNDGYSEADALVLLSPHAAAAGASPGHLEDKIKNVWNRYEPRTQSGQPSKSEAIDDFLNDIKSVEWICEPIIAKKSIGFVAGLPETSKTWMMIDLAVESARASGNWLGIFPVTSNRCLFVDQERFRGETQRRFNAVIAAKGLKRSDLRDSLFLKCGTSIKLDLEASFQAFRAELLDLRPSLVIVDSFATFHNSPENDRMAIQNVLNRIKALRDEIGCAFVFINHESKLVFSQIEENKAPNAYTMLGSVGIVAAAETVLVVRKIEAGLSMVHHCKSTLASASKSFTVAVEDMPNGGILVKGTL